MFNTHHPYNFEHIFSIDPRPREEAEGRMKMPKYAQKNDDLSSTSHKITCHPKF